MTQVPSLVVTPRLPAIVDKATFVIVVSSTTMKLPSDTTAAAIASARPVSGGCVESLTASLLRDLFSAPGVEIHRHRHRQAHVVGAQRAAADQSLRAPASVARP